MQCYLFLILAGALFHSIQEGKLPSSVPHFLRSGRGFDCIGLFFIIIVATSPRGSRQPLETSAKEISTRARNAPIAAAVMRLCGPNKIGNLPAYALPARRTISNRTANVPQLPVLRSDRAARAPPARRQLPAAARLLQAIQAK